jgi:hypothetical protein
VTLNPDDRLRAEKPALRKAKTRRKLSRSGGIDSRTKGKVGEREFAAFIKQFGFEARRGVQHAGGPDSPDVVTNLPGWHAEVKRVENLNIHAAMKQAGTDAAPKGLRPFVAHRRNRDYWKVTLQADHFLLLLKCQEFVAKALEGEGLPVPGDLPALLTAYSQYFCGRECFPSNAPQTPNVVDATHEEEQ